MNDIDIFLFVLHIFNVCIILHVKCSENCICLSSTIMGYSYITDSGVRNEESSSFIRRLEGGSLG